MRHNKTMVPIHPDMCIVLKQNSNLKLFLIVISVFYVNAALQTKVEFWSKLFFLAIT